MPYFTNNIINDKATNDENNECDSDCEGLITELDTNSVIKRK